ncbi:MAG: 4Fe-4S dicluster domain-containing protein [Bacteroidetes bacterium]|nr:4Fe-4S dicluster domain-containing protein [Bacteroidota bacterium]
MDCLYDKLCKDVRFREGLKACINCGTCTAICPAAGFYDYDPRIIADTVQSRNEEKIKELLSTDTIWYCGECMSCKTRCPRGNVPGLIITALRGLSQETGLFAESEKGRQQLAVKRTVGESILKYGYCVHPEKLFPELHPEQGPIWKWYQNQPKEVIDRMEGNYKGDGPGILRKIDETVLQELNNIFSVTGANERFEKIEDFSREKARELGHEFKDGNDCEYFRHVYTYNSSYLSEDETSLT